MSMDRGIEIRILWIAKGDAPIGRSLASRIGLPAAGPRPSRAGHGV